VTLWDGKEADGPTKMDLGRNLQTVDPNAVDPDQTSHLLTAKVTRNIVKDPQF